MFRVHLHWPTAFTLRILRVPIGISCLWWLITRRDLKVQVTPKSGAEERVRGQVPDVLFALVGLIAAVVLYALVGFIDWVPWGVTRAAAAASWGMAGAGGNCARAGEPEDFSRRTL